ncbi:related to proline-tRNA ligase [Fusarium fujikuroi]|nr:related to proline-tRNA ligase [Fusarium fujikuroi]SCO37233.1 related to proline-tRNA ligase [Fusarium fujikuroi]
MSNQKPAEIIGITATKEDDFPQWYQEVVVKAGMVEYYTEIAGLFVLRPLAMFIWSELRKWFQGHLDEMDIGETAFPLFLSAKSLAKEKDHIEGFAPELAWLYEDLLAVPIVRGRKTENERFAEGYYTLTLEGYIPSNGRGIQGATSHCLGQNFSKMFDISVEDPAGPGRIYAWQNSWAFSTRVIGVMVMIHGDNKGLVLPPRVAQTQIVMFPVGINRKTSAEFKDRLLDQLYEMRKTLKKLGLRVEVDTREGYTPAWKFNDWEMEGVPLRIEYGPKDAKTHVVSYAVRHNNKKGTMPVAEIAPQASRLLDQIQKDMYAKANLAYSQHRKVIDNWGEVSPALDSKNVVLIPFCLDGKCEDRMKQLTTKEDDLGDQGTASMGMKSLCIPFEQPGEIEEGRKCLNPECDTLAQMWTLFGRSH